ncbi:hypothetical protein [Brucella tritici]|uniref:Uncharacterized protein n=1 Tax=Brucella tritici TaxID=94626 RepID=A0A6L3YDW0_9HYPH|nr:hypothetical protein [Brucella tritici]KAB2680072.1 hypothetical protein F9L08_21990 [Brucella tritici]
MTFYANQKKTYPRTIRIAKIGREWIDVTVMLDKGHAKAKLKLDDNTKTLAVGTTISAQMSYLSDFGASPVKYAGAGNMEILSVDEHAAEKDAASEIAFKVMRKLKMDRKTSTLSLPSFSVAEATNRLLNDPRHPAALQETIEIEGNAVTLFDVPTLRKRVAIFGFNEKTQFIRAEYEVEKTKAAPAISARKSRFLAEAKAQVWDNCPHCRNEPVYMPKLVCENCW